MKIRDLMLDDRNGTIENIVDMIAVSWICCERILSHELRIKLFYSFLTRRRLRTFRNEFAL